MQRELCRTGRAVDKARTFVIDAMSAESTRADAGTLVIGHMEPMASPRVRC
jgi:hypothetical protein